MVSSILGQLEPPLGRHAVETSASANLISSSQAFQTGSVCADSLHRISVPFPRQMPSTSIIYAASTLGRCWQATGADTGSACLLPFPTDRSAKTARRAVPTGNTACPACCCWGCSAWGSNTRPQDTPMHATTHSPPLGLGQQGPHLSLPFFQTLSSFAKITTSAYFLA